MTCPDPPYFLQHRLTTHHHLAAYPFLQPAKCLGRTCFSVCAHKVQACPAPWRFGTSRRRFWLQRRGVIPTSTAGLLLSAPIDPLRGARPVVPSPRRTRLASPSLLPPIDCRFPPPSAPPTSLAGEQQPGRASPGPPTCCAVPRPVWSGAGPNIDRTRASDIWHLSEAYSSPSGEAAGESDSPPNNHATLPKITRPLGPTPALGTAFSSKIATSFSAPAARPRRADLRRALPGLHQGVAFGTRPRRSGAS